MIDSTPLRDRVLSDVIPQVFLVALQSERLIEARLGNLLTINAVFEDVAALLHHEGMVADYVVERDVHRGI